MSGTNSLFDDVVDKRIEIRRREMNIALTWCAILLLGFALVFLFLHLILQGMSVIPRYLDTNPPHYLTHIPPIDVRGLVRVQSSE